MADKKTTEQWQTEKDRRETQLAVKFYKLLSSEHAKKKLYEMARTEQFLNVLGLKSCSDVIEAVHLDIRRRMAMNLGQEYSEENVSTHFVCPVNPNHHTTGYDTKNGAPRYWCKECDKPHNGLKGTLLYQVGLDVAKWYLFIDGMFSHLSTEELMRRCEMSKGRVESWKHILFYALELLQKDTKLTGTIEADETYVKTSYKGKDRIFAEGVLRKAHGRGHETLQRDIQKDSIGIICAIDQYGHCIARVTGIGMPSASQLVDVLDGAIPYGNTGYFVTDGGRALAKFAELYHLNHLPLKNRTVEGSHYRPGMKWINGTLYSEQHINAMHSQLSKMLSDFRGISTKYLQGYLNLFCYSYSRGANLSSPSVYLDIIKILVTPNLGITSEELESHFNTIVSSYINNSELSGFLPVELEMYARFRNGEAIDEICSSLNCTREEFDTVKDDIEKEPHIANLAIAWYKRKQTINAEEQRRQQKELNSKERISKIIDYRVNEHMTYDEIGKVFGITHQAVSAYVRKARKKGYDIPERLPRQQKETVKRVKRHKLRNSEKLYQMDIELKQQYPNSTRSWRASQIAEKLDRHSIPAILTGIYKERKLRREAIQKHRKVSLQTWEQIDKEIANLVSSGMSLTKASKSIAQKTKIKTGTILAHANSKGIGRDNITSTTTIIEVLERVCKESFTKEPTTKKAIELAVAEELGITGRAVQIRIYRWSQKTGYEYPKFNMKSPERKKWQRVILGDTKAFFRDFFDKYMKRLADEGKLNAKHSHVLSDLARGEGISVGYARKIVWQERIRRGIR